MEQHNPLHAGKLVRKAFALGLCIMISLFIVLLIALLMGYSQNHFGTG